MRLRLSIQRHGLPAVKLLWTAGVLRPPYAAAGSSATISQLLEQVNEVVPLEADEWGLEDYAVEVRGFECLHFSEIDQVLKEDDEVQYDSIPNPPYASHGADLSVAYDLYRLQIFEFVGYLGAIRFLRMASI